jgi:elongation factor G
MPATEPGRIRNIAVVGHRGVGKTSLVEAMLFQAGKTNRLGTIEAGTTVSDWDDDEHRRQMSLSGTLTHLDWHERKINLVDAPGDAGFQADKRAEEYELSRVLFVNMLDRERADFYRALEAARAQLSDRCVAVQLPIGSEHELTGVVDLVHMCVYNDPSGSKEGGPQPIPDSLADQVAEYRE